MSLVSVMGESMAEVARVAAITGVAHQAEEDMAEAHRVIDLWKQHSANLERQVTELQHRLNASHATNEGLSKALQSEQAIVRDLSSKIVQQTHMQQATKETMHLSMKVQSDHRRKLEQRLARTEKALRHSSAYIVGVTTVHALLLDEVARVATPSQVSMLDKEAYRKKRQAAWDNFMSSGRLSCDAAVDRELKSLGAKVLRPTPSVARR